MSEIMITPSKDNYTADQFKIKIADPNGLMWLHTYMDYLMEREIKRTYRGNDIPDPDYKRICAAAGEKDTPENRERINAADRMAYSIGWINYDKEGAYSYGSDENLYRNNIIYVDKKIYRKYLSIENDDQRYKKLVQCFYLNNHPKNNELFDYEYYGAGMLDKFPYDRYRYGCYSRDILEDIKFNEARFTLINFLSKLTPGKWYTTESFIELIQKKSPYFFIPKNHKVSPYKQDNSRYADFYESSPFTDHKKQAIDQRDHDAFKRVEGRFIERFLESLPYTFGWVELAYNKKHSDKVVPSYGHLQAFKITPLLDALYKKPVPAPRVTLLPNYEMTVEGLFYPVKLMHQLAQLGDINHQGTVSQVTLNKDKIIKLSAAKPELDIPSMLKKITHQPLPHNVDIDLSEWCRQGDAFTLYTEAVLFESPYSHDCLKEHLVKTIAKGIFIVSDDQKLAAKLDKAQDVSLITNHPDNAFTLLPKSYTTRLPKIGVKQLKKKQPKRKIKLKKQTNISYDFVDKEAFHLIKDALIAKQIVIGVNDSNRTISFSKQHEVDFKQALKSVNDRYQFTVEEE